jgi:hypothetical protein
MKRFSVCLISLVVVLSVWAGPTRAQDKYTMGMTPGT